MGNPSSTPLVPLGWLVHIRPRIQLCEQQLSAITAIGQLHRYLYHISITIGEPPSTELKTQDLFGSCAGTNFCTVRLAASLRPGVAPRA